MPTPTPNVVTSYWDAAESTPGFEGPIARFREMIQSSQNPRTCQDLCKVKRKLWASPCHQTLPLVESVRSILQAL